jgi:regulator of replication initiation timing
MPRVTPLETNHLSEIDSLRADNASLSASVIGLQEHNGFLRAEITALQLKNEKLAELTPNPVVRSLCEKVAEMTLETEKYVRLIQAREVKSRILSDSLINLRDALNLVKQNEGGLQRRIFQLVDEIVALQDANHLKSMEIDRLKKCTGELREHLTCSISQELMTQPCVLSTGQVYEHGCIMEWLRQGRTCPNTSTRVMNHDYFPPASATLRNVCAIVARM